MAGKGKIIILENEAARIARLVGCATERELKRAGLTRKQAVKLALLAGACGVLAALAGVGACHFFGWC